MKRRVLREHANKRRLRLLSAEHGLRLDAYNVLCDASFLRAVALAEVNTGCSPAQSLKILMRDTFAAATSHVRQEGDSGVSSKESARSKDLTLCISYLPETATALRRLVQRQEEKQGTSSVFLSSHKKRKNAGKDQIRSSFTIGMERNRSIADVVELLLSDLECIERAGFAVHKNEAKAISQFVVAAASGQCQSHAMQGRRNAHCLFVATQSHDVRRLLPPNAALMRLTTSPTALWIEKNADSFHYGNNSTKKMLGTNEAAPVRGKGLSPADVAFIRHLSEDLLPGASANKRRRVVTPDDATRASADVMAATHEQTAMHIGTDFVVERKKKFRGKKKWLARPNPLAVKKKRVREVLRVDSGTRRKGH